jgi:predicted nucleic acid-binding protein
VAIILDADVIIRAERATFDLERWTNSLPDEDFQLAAITVAELWYGVERATAKYRDEREQYVLKVLSSLQILPYTEITAFAHARIWAELDASGRMISNHDLIVAATALEYGSAVATFNERHFSKVRGLKLISPS